MTRGEFRFFERLRVRWAEIDAQKIVFNGHYLMYVDTAIAGYWRALALPYAEAMQRLGGDLYVRKATVDYHASARYDELIDVGIRCGPIGRSSMRFAAGVFRGDDLLVEAELVYVFADPQAQASRPVPEPLRAVLEGYERGEPVIEVRTGDWADLQGLAQPVRQRVFVDEQRIPAALEWDADDATALHAVALNRLGMAVGTGRLLAHEDGVCKIGRMAVLAPMRQSRVGRRLLDALLDAARAAGYREALLHAQRSAVAFYRRAGFEAEGPEYEEAGIPHVDMRRRL